MSSATHVVQLETETVRVTRWDLPPGSATGQHVHEHDYVVVPITEGTLTATSTADGETVDAPLTVGDSYNREAGVDHDVSNRTDAAVAFVEVELLAHTRHRQIAVEQFNGAWDLIDKSDRTADEDVEMLLAAVTSRWHWARIGTAEQVATGDWQVAHVASLLGYGDMAMQFAARNLSAAEELGWTGWRLASAHEGVARACAAAGDQDGRDAHIAEANKALQTEPDAENAQHIADQLATIPTVGSAS